MRLGLSPELLLAPLGNACRRQRALRVRWSERPGWRQLALRACRSRRLEYRSWDSRSHRVQHVRWSSWKLRAYRDARVAESAAWGGLASAVRQHVSDGCYELTARNGGNTGLDVAKVASGMRGVTRQTGHAWADVRLVGLYPIFGSSKQDSGITEVTHSAYPGQYHQS